VTCPRPCSCCAAACCKSQHAVMRRSGPVHLGAPYRGGVSGAYTNSLSFIVCKVYGGLYFVLSCLYAMMMLMFVYKQLQRRCSGRCAQQNLSAATSGLWECTQASTVGFLLHSHTAPGTRGLQGLAVLRLNSAASHSYALEWTFDNQYQQCWSMPLCKLTQSVT
jgi:hypothetical protein